MKTGNCDEAWNESGKIKQLAANLFLFFLLQFISKLLRQNIEKYRSLFSHVSAEIGLYISRIIINQGDNIQYVQTDSNHSDPLYPLVKFS